MENISKNKLGLLGLYRYEWVNSFEMKAYFTGCKFQMMLSLISLILKFLWQDLKVEATWQYGN